MIYRVHTSIGLGYKGPRVSQMDDEKLKSCAHAAQDLLQCRAVVVVAIDDEQICPVIALDHARTAPEDLKYALVATLGALQVVVSGFQLSLDAERPLGVSHADAAEARFRALQHAFDYMIELSRDRCTCPERGRSILVHDDACPIAIACDMAAGLRAPVVGG